MSPHLPPRPPTAPALGHDLPPGAQPARAPLVRTWDFSTLPPAEATRLHGRRVRFRVELHAGTDDTEGDFTIYEAAGQDGAVLRMVSFAGELEAEGVRGGRGHPTGDPARGVGVA